MNKILNEKIVEKYPDFFPLPEEPRTLKDTFFIFVAVMDGMTLSTGVALL